MNPSEGTAPVNVLIFGAGAVGATVGGWLGEVHDQTWVLDVPKVAEVIEKQGDGAEAVAVFDQESDRVLANFLRRICGSVGQAGGCRVEKSARPFAA